MKDWTPRTDGQTSSFNILILEKMEMKRTVLALLLLAVATSCAKETVTECFRPNPSGKYTVELNGKVSVAGTRISEAEDPSNGLRTSWEAGEKIDIMYYREGTASLVSLTSAEGGMTFTGEVETGEDAQAFAGGDLYCVSSSSRIATSIGDNGMSCKVDLSDQNGTLEDVADRELMFVKGRASRLLVFEHLTSVLKLTFRGLTGSTVTSASFSFTPSAGSSLQALFAAGAEYSFSPDATVISTEDITFYDMSGISIPVENGCAVIYLVIPDRGKLSGELSVMLTCSGTTYRRYIKLSGKSFKAANVVARTEHLTDNDRVPDIGDYVYSDGSWGRLEYYEDKWPQAVIFSNYTSPSDRAAGYTHGYAMALRDAAWPTAWAPESEVLYNPDYPETPNVFESIMGSAPLQMMDDIDGLSTCTVLNNLYLRDYAQGNFYGMEGFVPNGKRAAIPCAMRYGKEDWVQAYTGTENIAPFEAPAGTSGWFLPSMGQWYLCLANLAGIDPNDLVMTTSGDRVLELAWKFTSSQERQAYLNKFTDYFNSNAYYNPVLGRYVSEGRMVATVFYLPRNGQMDWFLWACDEATSDGTATVVYLNSTDIVFKYVPKQTGDYSSNGYAARSILAF